MRGEFEFIKNIKERHGLAAVGDDCAVLPKDDATDMLVTSDMLVEDIDFRLDWSTPEQIGHKTLAVSLSDIAAMGGTPRWAMLSIAIEEDLWKTDFLDRFYTGWHRLGKEFGCELVGGDVSRTDGKLTVDCTVIGEVTRGRAILRSGAKAGDGIYVTGPLGVAAAGLRSLSKGSRLDVTTETKFRAALESQLNPRPRLGASHFLAEKSIATSMIDLSDGLSSDLRHLIEASDVGASIDLNAIPREALSEVEDALHGGEDLELLFTVDEKKLSSDLLTDFFRIGTITANVGMIELSHDDKTESLQSKGYRHF